MSSPELDRMARAQGYPDYATMQAWYAHRTAALTNQGPQTQQGGPSPSIMHPLNFLSYWLNQAKQANPFRGYAVAGQVLDKANEPQQ